MILSDGEPRSRIELVEETGLTSKAVGSVLYRLWRAGIRKNTRAYHLYLYWPGKDSVNIKGLRFVRFEERRIEKRRESKAEIIRRFLEENSERAFYSTEIVEALKNEGIEQRYVMSTVRKAERKGSSMLRQQFSSIHP